MLLDPKKIAQMVVTKRAATPDESSEPRREPKAFPSAGGTSDDAMRKGTIKNLSDMADAAANADEAEPETDVALESATEDVMAAFEAKDSRALMSALKLFVEISRG